jgi:archaellin
MSTSQVQPITSSVFTGYPDGATPFDSETSQKLVDSINLLLKETTGASSSIDFTKRIVVLLDPKGNSVLACMDQNLADMDLSQQVNYEVNLLKIGVQIDDERGKIGFHNFEILDSLKGLAHSEEKRVSPWKKISEVSQ